MPKKTKKMLMRLAPHGIDPDKVDNHVNQVITNIHN